MHKWSLSIERENSPRPSTLKSFYNDQCSSLLHELWRWIDRKRRHWWELKIATEEAKRSDSPWTRSDQIQYSLSPLVYQLTLDLNSFQEHFSLPSRLLHLHLHSWFWNWHVLQHPYKTLWRLIAEGISLSYWSLSLRNCVRIAVNESDFGKVMGYRKVSKSDWNWRFCVIRSILTLSCMHRTGGRRAKESCFVALESWPQCWQV